MGELYLDNVERYAVNHGNARASVNDRPRRRFVADPDVRRRCTSCGRTASRPRVIDGKTCCAVHVPGVNDTSPAGELMTTLQGWFSHDAANAGTAG